VVCGNLTYGRGGVIRSVLFWGWFTKSGHYTH